MQSPDIFTGADKHMEIVLRNDVADCERRVRLATPKPVISKGKLIQRGDVAALEVAERQLARARQRLEQWLIDRGM